MKRSNYAKTVVLVLILVLVLGVTGCSQDELDYINLMKEISSQNQFEANGSISLQLNSLPESLTAETDKTQLAVLEKFLTEYSLTYLSKVDYSNNLAQAQLNIKERASGIEKEIFSVLMKDKICYIRIKEVIDFVKSFNDQKLNDEINKILGNAEYISISAEELTQLSDLPPNSPVIAQQSFDLNKQKEFGLLWIELINNLATQAYNNYESGLIEKSGNQYVLTVKADDLSGFIKTFAVYTVSNVEKLGPCLKTFINSMNNEHLALLGMTEEIKMQALPGIDVMVAEVAANRAEYLTKLNAIDKTNDSINEFEGSKLVSSIEKTSTNNYKLNSTLQIKYTDPNKDKEKMDLVLVSEETYQPCSRFDVQLPAAGVLTITELNNRIPPQVSIHIDTGLYTQQKGIQTKVSNIELKVIDGYVYLPLRRLAENFGENVGWDDKNSTAYVERNGERIDMTGLLLNNLTHVKIRDFEKLGYTVNWDPIKRVATVRK